MARPTDAATIADRSEIAAITSGCVEQIRLERNLTRPDLATASGLSEHLVDRIEGVKGPPSIPGLLSLVRLSKALDTKPSKLAEGIRYIPDPERRSNVSTGRRPGQQSGPADGVFVRLI